MNPLKKITVWLAFLLLASGAMAGTAQDVKLPYTHDLLADAELAQEKHLPIMLLFVADNCGYCKALEADYIKPMLFSGEYNDKVIIRVINISNGDIMDFNGRPVSGSSFATHMGAYVTPTIVFVDDHGQPTGEKILGYGTPGLFGGQLDDAIDQSLEQVRSADKVSY